MAAPRVVSYSPLQPSEIHKKLKKTKSEYMYMFSQQPNPDHVFIFFSRCILISVTFFDNDGEQEIKVPVGMSMLEAAHENDIELEGACEGSLACSTCHVIVMYNKLEDPTDEENDMLDLAFGLTETSRLGCQVIAKPELDGLRLALPAATRNFAVDGYKPKPH
ncbi:hypothetical protein M8C21_013170 [Ambrosia artemisiifolia]|uniref:2Fe-2S ferredoxin-type domain-containing protein n=1 Tax=Ambrosia artemisiifolia TaxID=4212 RepID=A0AAD5G456_AMBAR|nr:hypothetical protein M8C21_013170 [Ambrosia artemisiifolia]